jgi:branched-chain amino acid transport system substrate-binding protein
MQLALVARRTRLGIAALALVLMLVPGTIVWGQAPDLRVGVFGPLTGDAAADGNGCLYGVQMAAEQANAMGGIDGRKFAVSSADDQASPSEGITAVQKLITRDRVTSLISCSYSGATRTAAAFAQRARVPLVVSYAVHPEITKAGNYVWRVFSLGGVQGNAIAVMAREDGKASKAAILWVKNDYGQSISQAAAERFGKLGGQVVFNESFQIGDKDFTTLVTKARAANPDVLMLVSYYTEGGLLVPQARRLGLTVPIYGSDGLSAPKFVELAAQAADGVIMSAATNLDSSGYRTFAKAFETKYKYIPDSVASHGHDAMLVLIEATRRGGTTPDAVLKGLGMIDRFTGVNGTIIFTPDREVVAEQSFWKIVNGQFVQYKLIPYDQVK